VVPSAGNAEQLPAPRASSIPDCDAPRDCEPANPCQPAQRSDPEHYVDVHLATPYGVSGHLLIPLITDEPCKNKSEPAPAACSLLIAPPASIALTASPTKAGNWRVNEYFASVPESIVIRVPKWFVAPAKADINWTIREHGSPDEPGPVVGKLSVPAPQFQACTPAYVFDGGELRNLVGDTSRPASDKTLHGAIKLYLDHVGSKPGGTIERDLVATAAIAAGGQSIPIEGSLEITVRKTSQPVDE
jgi:hypothetical protein